MDNKIEKIYFKLPPPGLFKFTGPTDPINYYYKPLVGKLYINRIQAGLNLLKPPYKSVLEFGYGSGLLLPTLAGISDNLIAVDIDTNPELVYLVLKKLNINARLIKNDLIKSALPASSFDLIVAFSVFEHIKNPEPILNEMKRILKPGGELIVGMPRVDNKMSNFFSLIGYDRINELHVMNYKNFLKVAENHFILLKFSGLPSFLPSSCGIYFNMLFKKFD